jgi:hypothetical protein
MILINKSFYKYCFEERFPSKIFLLSEIESSFVYDKYNVDSILDSSNRKIIYHDFVTNLNTDKDIDFSFLEWEDSDEVYFVISRYIIIYANWFEFKYYWRNMLCIDDDSVVLVNINSKFALLFVPLGNIFQIDR